MSTAKLNIWVTEVGNPCKIDMERQWYVHILHCDGSVLNWCDRRYTNLLTKCGHLEVEVPPGCYMVVATWSKSQDTAIRPTRLGNHLTHLQVARVNCGDHACITLFPPTAHFCGIWWVRALEVAALRQEIPRPLADEARQLVAKMLEATGEKPDPLAEALLKLDDAAPEKVG